MTAIARGGVLALFFIAALVLALGIVKVDVHKAGAHHEFDPNCLTHPQTHSGFLWCPNGPQSHETPSSAPGEDPPPPEPVQVQAPAPPPTTEDPPPATEDPPPTTVPPPPARASNGTVSSWTCLSSCASRTPPRTSSTTPWRAPAAAGLDP